MNERECSVCGDPCPDEDMDGDTCRFCRDKQRFAAFAREAGLAVYPDPTGERYVYRLDGQCAGKKSENPDLINVLWNALVRAKGGGDDLLIWRE